MGFHRSVTTIGLFTLLSRLLGFVRDLLTATLLGAGPIADAFVVAQRLPYAFRAFFAEGAIDTSFVPVYATKLHQEGPAKAELFARQIFTLIILVLVPFTVLSIIFMPHIVTLLAPGFKHDGERFPLAVMYTRITFSYLILISITALQGTLLNAHGKFSPGALAQIALNIVMIVGLLLAWGLGLDIGRTGCWAMIAGGIVQLVMLYIFCRRQKIFPLHFTSSLWSKDVKRFLRLLGPGIAVTSSLQIYVVLSTILASTLPAGAVSALYY
ncbi:MAG: lipid II flippase MurJ, partial [Proteobacteria bacterium]|nr:lipid II flippase MurJ [Pseudomonadota bacterium]